MTRNIEAADVRRTASILALLPADRQVRKTGAGRWITRCVFHEDSRASMSIGFTNVGWVYRCFSCGEFGDVIRFVMNVERMSFREAMQRLVQHAPPPVYMPPEKKTAFIVCCDGKGCTETLDVDVQDIPFLGNSLHVAWDFERGNTRCPSCCRRERRPFTRGGRS